jgi:hypothetical protein
LSLVVPSEIGDQTAMAGEAEHGWKTRTRATPAMLMASAAYVRVVIVVVPLLLGLWNIRTVS